MSVTDHYIPVLDPSGRPTIDQNTGQPKYRLGSKTVTANIYSGYIWNEDTKKFEGVNKVGAKTEEWHMMTRENDCLRNLGLTRKTILIPLQNKHSTWI